MKVTIIRGPRTNEIILSWYDYLIEKYQKGVLR